MARYVGGIPGGGYEGKFGNAVFYRVGDETLMRSAGEVSNPRTPAQTGNRQGFGRAAQGWRRLSDTEFAAWEAAGGYRRYMSLTRKWLRVFPQGVPPRMPPVGAFLGEDVRLVLSPLPQPPLQEEPLGGGASLTLVADRANGAGVVTEILVQPLAHARRKPKSRAWRTAGFFAFTDEVRAVQIPVEPGAWAVSYRFVDATSGRETALASLGAVTVGGEA